MAVSPAPTTTTRLPATSMGANSKRHRGRFLEKEGQRLDDAPGDPRRGRPAAGPCGNRSRGTRRRTHCATSANVRFSSSLTPSRKMTPRFWSRSMRRWTTERSTLNAGVPFTSSPPGTSAESKNGHGIAALGEFISAGQTAWAGADDGDAQAIRWGGAGINLPVGKGVFGEELFEGADGHRLGHAVENAGAFAQTIGRADPGADFRHVGGGPQHGGSLQEAAFGGQEHPLRNGVAQGAAGDTARVRALDATAGLLAGGGFIVEAVVFPGSRPPVPKPGAWAGPSGPARATRTWDLVVARRCRSSRDHAI